MKKNNVYQYAEIKKYSNGMIRGLTKKLGSFRFGHNERGKTEDLCEAFCTEVGMKYVDDNYGVNGAIYHFETPRKIELIQTNLGKAWLKNHFYKLNGEVRSGKNTENVSDRVLKISKAVSRFEFIGVLGLRNGFGEYCQWLPIYRTYNRAGEYFDYAPVHWGQPVIMEGN